MACTIDHLRVDHHVTVLRDFTDLAGVTIRAGEAGMLRGLGLDYGATEIWIELERQERRDKLRFALRATDGPRNGHMKEYFEMGEAVATPSAPTIRAAVKADSPQRTQPSFQACAGRQAPNDTSLGERCVACNCDPAFHRDLLSARGGLSVSGCLCCGTVTCWRSFGDDGRFTGDAWLERRTVALDQATHRWIAGWPRVKADYATGPLWPMSADFARYSTLYYPAETRCNTVAQLAELEARLAREQADQSRAARLRATHRVPTAPPAGLPEELCGYALLWKALQFRPDTEVSDLFHHAQPRSPGCEVAAEVLRQRPDAFELIVSALHSGDAARRGAGFVMARDWRPPDPRLPGVLIELMQGFSFDPLPEVAQGIVSRGRFEMILLLIAELRLGTPEMLAVLKTLMRQFARHDDFLVDCVRIVLCELNATPRTSSTAA